jgi:Zn-dependent peptidase ImmA (M78 family)
MDWKAIDIVIQKIVSEIKEKCIIQNTAIRDGIFDILENNCTVVYYPLENEKNRGFHIKRIVKNELEDFVYINTAKPIAEQIFAAAHELGHIFGVSEKVWKMMGYSGTLTEEDEENITNRFAAELLMPADVFKEVFGVHMKVVGIKNGKVKVDDLVRVMVMQMNAFLVPYEAVRRRLVEIGLMQQSAADFLESKEDEILHLVDLLTKYQNSYLEKETGRKTISGIRELIEDAETRENIDAFLVKRIKRDLEIADMPEADELEIHIGDKDNE